MEISSEHWISRKSDDVLIYLDDQYTIVFSGENRGRGDEDGNDATIVDASNTTTY